MRFEYDNYIILMENVSVTCFCVMTKHVFKFVKPLPCSHSQLLGCMSFGIKNITEKLSVSEIV